VSSPQGESTLPRLRGRYAALTRWSLQDGVAGTAKARQAFRDRFIDQVDPERKLPEAERARRAEAARKAHYVRMAYRSAVARQGKKSR
jgi:hypothetical protein